MQIAQINTSSGIATSISSSGNASAVDETALALDGASTALTTARPAAAPVALRRGLSKWDHQLQGEISSAQQALNFLDQSASQLQALKSELAGKLAGRQGRDGQVEARVRQFSNTWRTRQDSSGGTLDAQLSYSSSAPATQRFKIRGLSMANLQAGGKEVLAFSVAGASQSLPSVSIESGMSEAEIASRFDQALAQANIRASVDDAGSLVFSTPESSWTAVRDSLAVRGGGIRFPSGQLNRVKTDEETAVITPESWSTADPEALRQTLQQVVQALSRVRQARAAVSQALDEASNRVAAAQMVDSGISMDRLAQNFITTANQPGYDSLLSITSALGGISRERVRSLLGPR